LHGYAARALEEVIIKSKDERIAKLICIKLFHKFIVSKIDTRQIYEPNHWAQGIELAAFI